MTDMLNKIILWDCLDVMKGMSDKCVDLVLTDPPYGINADKGVGGGIHKGRKYKGDWDSGRPSKEYFDEILRISKNAIIFGGNYFTDLLPCNNHWIVWDKVGEIKFDNPYSGAELCWTNINKNTVKKYVFIQAEFIKDTKDERIHPTQKATELISMILRDYSKENDIIFDPFIGYGTTAIACIANNRRFIGVEKDPEYHRLACERVEKEKQNLFNLEDSKI